MKIIFLGTPDFAVKSLAAVINSKHQIMAVVTQPDRLGNRNKIVAPPVKDLAVKNELTVLQFEKISKEGVDILKKFNADIMVTCAYGQILSEQVLSICPKGVINVHASLLPKYRGSSPIQWCVINGESESGVTIMQTAKAVDSGDIILQEKCVVDNEITAGELFEKLSDLGATALIKALDLIESGNATFTPQDHTQATHCKFLTKQDGCIDFSKTSREIVNFVRGMHPWPCAFTFLNGELLKVHKAESVDCKNVGKFGEIIESESQLIVACGNGCVKLSIIQSQGGKSMNDNEYLRGHKINLGTILGARNE